MALATQAASSSTSVLPETFSKAQAKKAVDALLAHHAKVTREREETELVPREEHVWLVVNTKRGSTKRKMMPKRIQLPNPPLPPPPATAVGLITKPPQREYKDLLASEKHNIKFINRVVDTDKLKGKWKPFEARRNLARENDIWLADERVIPVMPKLLGKTFFDAKKIPIPVNLQRKDLKAELGRAINSTYFHPSTGTSHSIRIATPPTSTPNQTLENLLAAVPSVVALLQDGWDNILSIGIKTSSSVLLPVWNSKLDDRFTTKDAAAAESTETVEESSEGKKSEKSKKRGAEVDEGVTKKRKSISKDDEDVPATKTSESKNVAKKGKTGSGVGAEKAEKLGKKDLKKSSSIGSGAAKKSKVLATGKQK